MHHLLVILPYRFLEETLEALLVAATKLNTKLSFLSKTALPKITHQYLGSTIYIKDEKRTVQNEEELLLHIDKLFEEAPFSAVINYAEAYVCLAAKLTSRYNLEGNSTLTALLTRDKYAMRKILDLEKICIPKFEKASNFNEYKKAIKKVGFPCVSKPIDGAASNGVLKLTKETNLQQAYEYTTSGNSLQSTEIIVESYIAGKEVSVEGIVVKGKLTILGVTAKETEAEPFFNELMHIHPAVLTPDTEKQLHRITEQTITALGIVSGGIHLEAKITTEGIFVIECASRPGGDNIPQLIQLASGYDMHECMLRSALNLTISLAETQPKQTAGIIFVQTSDSGMVKSVHICKNKKPKETQIKAVQLLCKKGDKLGRPPQYKNCRIGYAVALGSSRGEVKSKLIKISKSFIYKISLY